jgi:signal transduction histidine kinase
MKGTWRIYAAMALLAAVAIGAMAYVTNRAMEMERRQQLSQRFAAEQEKVRLALWRMDAAAVAVLAAEGGRPLEHYKSTMLALQDMTGSAALYPLNVQPVEVASPLLLNRGELVRMHFVYDGATGLLSSPQAPDANAPPPRRRFPAVPWHVPPQRLAEDWRRLEELRGRLRCDLIAARMRTNDASALAQANQEQSRGNREISNSQLMMNQAELTNRAQNAYLNNDLRIPSASESPPLALWQNGSLLIVRGCGQGRQMRIAGAWLDWPAVEKMLLSQVRDLLPHARLEAIEGEPDPADANRLASLPVRLAPGAVPVEADAALPLLTGPLAAAWICLLAALLAGAGVLRAVVNLAERRRAFVSAVTHELRTPLTTFRLYSEMLADGMVTGEAKRRDYLQKLHDESLRLSHLVENVLAYSRLSGPRRGPLRQRITLGDLVARAREGLEDLARRAGMELVIEPAEPGSGKDGDGGQAGASRGGGDARSVDPSAVMLEADVGAVEQILVNLVDNACKYAARADDRRIHIVLARDGAWGVIRVRDNGPGIEPHHRRKLFSDFARSAADAAGNPPGVGLGLAISRRLARQMRGDLRYDGSAAGASFTLRLPAAK